MTKLIMGLGMSLFALVSLSSCSNEEGMDPSLELYQQYEVIVTSASKAAYANFRIGSAAGERVELTDGSWLKINALDTYYQQSESATVPEFNYAVILGSNHNKAIFTFHRSKDMELRNSVSFEHLPRIGIDTGMTTVTNGVPLNLDLAGINPMNVDVTLRTDGATLAVYNAVYGPRGFEFRDVPAGSYTLVADYVQVTPTESNDGNAGGSITLISRNYRERVTVQ